MKKKNTFLRVGLVLTALVVGFIVLGLFTPAAAVRRTSDGHGQVRPRHFEPRYGRRR